MNKQEADRITNRQIAQLLDSIEDVFTLPDIVKQQIIKYMHYLKSNLIENQEGSYYDRQKDNQDNQYNK